MPWRRALRLKVAWMTAGRIRALICLVPALSFAVFGTYPVSVVAQSAAPATQTTPLLLSADEITYDEQTSQVTARGNVEVIQADRILRTDALTYNQASQVVAATGNVAIVEPSGDVIFADYVELSEDLRQGVIDNIRILLSDNSRMAAVGGQRTDTRTEMRRAVYSACDLCEKDPSRPPLWQVRAQRIVHDEVSRDIIYTDAVVEFFGVPVAYTPYLSHPDPTVKTRTGFLAPTLGSTKDIGQFIKTPYFVSLAPDEDFTVEPIFSTETVVVGGEYRKRFTNGEIVTSGSITQADRKTANGTLEQDRTRGHIFSRSRFDIDDTWRAGGDLQRSSDDTYLRRFRYGTQKVLRSTAFVEGFHGRSYANASSYLFQDMRPGIDDDTVPIVLPSLAYNFVGEPSASGGRWLVNASALGLTRYDGTDSHRISAEAGWMLPYIAPAGDVYTVTATIRGDGYLVNDFVREDGKQDNGLTGRVFPQIAFDWRYPFVRTDGAVQQFIEPILGVVAAPSGGNPNRIPNEDSQRIDLDDVNIFSHNRFTGLDRVEPSSRVAYGVKFGAMGARGGGTSVFLGQSFRMREETLFPAESGLRDEFSDIVGRVRVDPADYLSLMYRFRMNTEHFENKRNEFVISAGVPAFRVFTDYVYADRPGFTNDLSDIEQVYAGFSSRILPDWTVTAATRRDLTNSEGALSYQAGLIYEDECFILGLTYVRSYTSDREISPGQSILLRFALKTLGEVKTRSGL